MNEYPIDWYVLRTWALLVLGCVVFWALLILALVWIA